MTAKVRILSIIVLISVVGLVFSALQVDSVNWRAVVVRQKALGELEDISWQELLSMLRPGSQIYIKKLVNTPNPYAVIRNPFRSIEDLADGRLLFERHCMQCHGEGGAGGTAPNIASGALKHGDSDWAIFRTVKYGVAGTAMMPAALNDDDRWRITRFVLDLRHVEDNRESELTNLPSISVPYERILHAADEPHNWLTYSGRYDGLRHQPLNAINPRSLDRLGLRWVHQTDVSDRIEATPIVVEGVMYLSLPEGTVVALDATNGAVLWRWTTPVEEDLPVCCGRVNRGVAILDDRVYATTLDNRLQSLDAKTGTLIWEQTVADHSEGYTITVAPLAIKNQVIVGVSGGEYGIRGFLDAYDAQTGELAWRFYTVPAAGEPGNETWAGDSWKTGGGPTWVTGSVDPELNLVYWGVGNPSPDFDGSVRAGDNLYTNSVVALDIDSGQLKWHYQFTPHGLWDYDSNQTPILADLELEDGIRSVILWANRNGFFYVLDRTDGSYMGSVPFAKHTWATGIDESGRPMRSAEATPSRTGTIVWPGGSGATNWAPSSFSPVTGLFYVVRSNRASVYFNHEATTEQPQGGLWLGSTSTMVPDSSTTSMVAIDPKIPAVVWEKRLPDVGGRARSSGVMTTPELVFAGAGESLFALAPDTGDVVWSVRLGGTVGSPPTSYAVGGEQYLTIAAGKNVYAFSVPAYKDENARVMINR